MAEDIVKLLCRSVSPVTFLIPSADAQFQGNRFSEDSKYTGGGTIRGKNCVIRLKSPFI